MTRKFYKGGWKRMLLIFDEVKTGPQFEMVDDDESLFDD